MTSHVSEAGTVHFACPGLWRSSGGKLHACFVFEFLCRTQKAGVPTESNMQRSQDPDSRADRVKSHLGKMQDTLYQ